MFDELNNAPSPSDLIGLPKPVAVLFAARTARRVEHLFALNWPDAPDFRIEALDKAITAAEEYAAAPHEQRFSLQTQAEFTVSMAETAAQQALNQVAPPPEEALERSQRAQAAARTAALAAKTCTGRDISSTSEIAAECVATALAAAPAAVESIRADISLLKRLVQQEQWGHQSAIQQKFFWLRSEFDTTRKLGAESINEICADINIHLSEFYGRNPEKLYSLTMSGFLEVIGEQLEPHNFKTEFHTRTRDGSHDIAGVFSRSANARYLLECKAYAEEKRIDIRPVMALNGGTLDTDFVKGVIATSARPSEIETATGMYERNQYLLPAEEYGKLLKWLAAYQRHALRVSAGA